MAIASVGTAGTTTSKTSGTTVVLTLTATIQANNVAVVWFSGDNIDTATGGTNHLTCTDSQGNTYTKVEEHTYSEGVAGDGIMGALFYSRVSTEIVLAVDTITVTSDTALTAKAMSVWEFSAGAALAVGQTIASETNDDPPTALTLSGMTSRSYLFLRLDASEDNTDLQYLVDPDYTLITSANTVGGALITNACVNGQFRIATLTEDTCGPADGEARDRVQILTALYETAATDEAIVPATITGHSAVTATLTESSGGFSHISSTASTTDGTLFQLTGSISSSCLAVLSVGNVSSVPSSPTITDTSGKAWTLIRSRVAGSYRLSSYYALFTTGASITVSATFGSTQDACALSLEQLAGVHMTLPLVQSAEAAA